MKRFVLCICVGGLLAALPAPAFGFSSQFNYTGHVRGNDMASVGFFVKQAAGGTRKVTGFTATNTPYTCTNAPSGITTGWRFTPNMRVKSDRTFEGRGDWVELPLDPVGTVSGKLRRGGVAAGDFKLRGELAGPGTDCRTGLLEWRATKQQPPV